MATNPLGRLIYIEQYGLATVKASTQPSDYDKKWRKYGKYSAKNPTKITTTKTTNITSGSLTITYKDQVIWKKQSKGVTIKDKGKTIKNQQYKNTWQTAWTTSGFLSGIGDDYESKIEGGRWRNARFCDSVVWDADEIKKGTPSAVKYFPTPSVCDISLQDIDVEVDDETKKKTVTDVGRGQDGKLARNRIRDNVLKVELEWFFLTPKQASALLQLLSNHQKKPTKKGTYEWLRVRLLNPYTNDYETHTMYAGDRSLSATYNGNYTSLKVSLVEK